MRRISARQCAFFFALLAYPSLWAKPLASDACFRRVYQHAQAGYNWQVFECNTNAANGEVYYKASLTTPKDGKLASPVFTATPQTDTLVQLVQPDLLLINWMDERNGEALFLRPIQKTSSFSIARFSYLATDDTSLQILKNGDTLTFLPAQNRQQIVLKPDGHLSLIR